MTGNPADSPHEVRVAKNVVTVLRFKSQITRDAVEVDGRGTRITVDVGDNSIILEPLTDLGSTERLVLSVAFSNGHRAVFVLMSHASEVDTRIEVVRREQTVEACQAELAEAQARCSKISPVHFARAGWLSPTGVITRKIDKCTGTIRTADGLVCANGETHRAGTWALVAVTIHNERDQQPWVPREVTIKGMKSGVLLTVREVEPEPAQVAPGEEGHVFVEIAPPNSGERFVLELRDATGRGITIPEVNLSEQENQR